MTLKQYLTIGGTWIVSLLIVAGLCQIQMCNEISKATSENNQEWEAKIRDAKPTVTIRDTVIVFRPSRTTKPGIRTKADQRLIDSLLVDKSKYQERIEDLATPFYAEFDDSVAVMRIEADPIWKVIERFVQYKPITAQVKDSEKIVLRDPPFFWEDAQKYGLGVGIGVFIVLAVGAI